MCYLTSNYNCYLLQIIASLVSPSPRLDCTAPLTAYMNISQGIEMALTPGPGGLDMFRLETCLARAPAYLEDMLGSVTS